jgi:hypothetical protein
VAPCQCQQKSGQPHVASGEVVGLGDVGISWQSVRGAVSHEVFQRAEPTGYAEGLGNLVASVSGTSWPNTGALSGSHHAIYQVLAVSGSRVRSAFAPREGAIAFSTAALAP